MALADRRPFGIPVSSTPASPAYNPRSLSISGSGSGSSSRDSNDFGSNANGKALNGEYAESDVKPFTPEKSTSPSETSSSRSISPDSLMSSENSKKLNHTSSSSSRGSTPPSLSAANIKKPKTSARVPIATGISTTIPVTGEKPKPDQKNDPSLEDDVLFAIFLILYEKDPEGNGMTVKQICDILVERHPEMANLSTKTSNLVSAKLNAYVKRVEKGDSNLKYALSRDWADASPKRMVYVYRGLLAEDFHVHVKNVMEVQKQLKTHSLEESTEPTKLIESVKSNDQAFDYGIPKNSFMNTLVDKSNLFVPYSTAPVTASLTESINDSNVIDKSNNSGNQDSDLDFQDFEAFNEDDEDTADFRVESWMRNGKRSKSMSYLSSKKAKILTAAAAAPRAPRTPCAHSPNAAAAAAALHEAALKAISNPSQSIKPNNENASSERFENKKWLSVVRSGFLTQEIGTPEDISLSDLDKFFA